MDDFRAIALRKAIKPSPGGPREEEGTVDLLCPKPEGGKDPPMVALLTIAVIHLCSPPDPLQRRDREGLWHRKQD